MFFTSFQNLPIKNKLLQLIMMITCTALLTASIISAFLEIYLLKRSVTENLTVLASAIAVNSTAAVAFRDPVSATEILKALQAEDDIQLGAIYIGDNSLFAKYEAPFPEKDGTELQLIHRLPSNLPDDRHYFIFKDNRLWLDLFQPIVVDGERQGTLFLRSNLNTETNSLFSFSLAMMLIMLFIAVVVYLSAYRLQKLITAPIRKLAQTANTIAKNKDYSIRVNKLNQDEIGLLIDAFNEMLTVIQEHEAEISAHRKQLETQVKERTKELANERDKALAATQAKSQFLANMSHEIRTPMNAMIGMLSLLQDAPLPDKDKTYLDTAISSSNTLLNVIDGILDFSKIEAGKLVLENIDFNLCRLIQEVTALFINAAQQKHLTLSCSIPQDINCQVRGDPTRVRQILYNLVSNAVKFTSLGKITLGLRLEQADDQGQLLRFSVADTGIGIAKEDIPLLFRSFTQLDGSTTRKFGGTGLGLVVCKQLIELMGGQIGLESSPGKGSLFWFTLHMPRATNGITATQPADTYPGQPSKKKLRGNILLADDDPVNRTVAAAMLETVGLRAETAENGNQAVGMALDNAFDLILMDCQMPEMDGYQATQYIRRLQHNRRSIIIGITANAMPEDKQKCLASGMDDYLPKPIDLNTFINLLERWLPAVDSRLKSNGGNSEMPLKPQSELWNKQAALKNIYYDEKILRKIIAIFLEQYPLQLTRIGEAIDNLDAVALQQSVHLLRGSVDNFWTTEIYELLRQLENKARSADFSGVQDNYRRLQQLIAQLAEQLKKF